MEEVTYRKIQCNAGHFSRVFTSDEILPRRCPICNQPYDRRYNRPIVCNKDGSLLEEQKNDDNSTGIIENVLLENKQEEVNKENYRENFFKDELATQEISRRGHQISPKSYSDMTVFSSRRRVSSEINDTKARSNNVYLKDDIRKSQSKNIVLFTGGNKIEIPSQGGYLGRNGIGEEYFIMNSLISRKHAYINVDHFGNLQIRDEESLNGTYVDDGNGRRQLKKDELAMLKVGNKIWLANQILVIEEEVR